jgi:hypothetical protein
MKKKTIKKMELLCNRGIEREDIDKFVDVLARISRNLLSDYLDEYGIFGGSEHWRDFPDATFWREKWWKLREDNFEKEPAPIG